MSKIKIAWAAGALFLTASASFAAGYVAAMETIHAPIIIHTTQCPQENPP